MFSYIKALKFEYIEVMKSKTAVIDADLGQMKSVNDFQNEVDSKSQFQSVFKRTRDNTGMEL